MEMSDFMKRHWAKYCVNASEKANNRKDSLACERKAKRDTEAFARRNIDLNMTPYVSPALPDLKKTSKVPQATTKVQKKSPPTKATSSRLEMLAKWKAEKEKQRQIEKAKKKPIFKVFHIATSTKVDLENVNKMIKGKPIPAKPPTKPNNMQFVSRNHQFSAPKGVKPLYFKAADTAVTKAASAEAKPAKASNQTEKVPPPKSCYNLRSGPKERTITLKEKKKESDNKKVGSRSVAQAGQSSKIEAKISVTTPKKTQTVTSRPQSSKLPGKSECDSKLTGVKKDKPPKTPVYNSPFVTTARGKANARDEYKVKHATCDEDIKNISVEIVNSFRSSNNSQDGADYFMRLLDSEIERINGVCEKWESFLQGPAVVDEATSSINVAVGQAKLLIAKKFNQFRNLIMQCKTQNFQEKEITCQDLHGFWDMIYMQIEDLDKRFANLDRLKESNWEEMLPERKVEKPRNKPKVKAKKPAASSKLKDLIKAARAKQKEEHDDVVNEVARGVEALEVVRTPKKTQEFQFKRVSATPKRKSVRVSMIASESTKRCSSSPGLTMMKVTQSIKQGNGLTPAKSILKIEGVKSTGKKSVVFRESLSQHNYDVADNKHEKNIKGVRRSFSFSSVSGKENSPSRRSLRVKTECD